MNTTELPADYRSIRSIDMQKDKRLSLKLNLVAVVIALLLVIVGGITHPPRFRELQTTNVIMMGLVIIFGSIGYIVLHELTHGVCIRLLAGVRPEYGFTGLYASAGSKRVYFDRRNYLIIALAPVVLWGVVLLVLNLLLPVSWFWPIYLIQIVNLSGAAGDFYVTGLLLFRLPRDILVRDIGVSMEIFAREA